MTVLDSVTTSSELVERRAVLGGVRTPSRSEHVRASPTHPVARRAPDLVTDPADGAVTGPVGGVDLDELDDQRFTDDLLDAVWHELGLLHLVGVAHGDVDLDRFVVDRADNVWITGLDRARLDPHDGLLSADLGALLAATATRVGVQRAVDTAVRAVGTRRLAEAVPRLRLSTLPASVARRVRRQKLLAELRVATSDACGLAPVTTTELRRVTPRGMVSAVMGAAALWFLVPQVLDAGDLWTQVTAARWPWLVAAIASAVVALAGAGLAIVGAVPEPVPYRWAAGAAVASSFSNSVAPSGIGGLALTTRFYQRQGIDTAVAVSGVGINTIAGVVVHVVISAGILAAMGRADLTAGLSISWHTAGFAAALGIVPAAGAFALPRGRRLIRTTLWPEIRSAGRAVSGVVRNPVQLRRLLTGSALITMAHALCLVVSVRAFGGTTSTVAIVLLYLSASIVASVAPTPGGLGAAEAAYIGGLRAAGEDPGIALAAVFVFRFATFWLPILPGWIALRALEHRKML